MEIVIEKLKKIIEEMYVKELLGVGIYDNIPDYILNDIEILRKSALEYEIAALKNDPNYDTLRRNVGDVLNRIADKLKKDEKNWRKPPYLLDFF